MALIKCPECGHNVSDKASSCPNCGYPIQKNIGLNNTQCPFCGKEISENVQICPGCSFPISDYNALHCNDVGKTTKKHCPVCNTEMAIDKSVCPNCNMDVSRYEALKKIEENRKASLPHCPVCNSTDLSKLSAVKKAGKIWAFGLLGAGDVGKTFKCNKCGYKF